MVDAFHQETEQRMVKAVEKLSTEFSKLRTGRAHPSLLDHLTVQYYGTDTPLSQVASIAVSDARTLMITPWEKSMVSAIEKAILTSDLGLNPATSSDNIRVPLPPMTEERRKEMVKLLRQETENARVAVRNIRRDANNHFNKLLKEKQISEDDERRHQDKIQKLTDKYIANIDKMLDTKEKDVMEI